jgi:D-erythronate 2-dehydrogenase
VIDSLLHAATLDTARLPASRSLLLPTVRVTMAELAEAIGRVYAMPAPDLVRWVPEKRIEALFGRYPPLRAALAEAAGFASDGDADTLARRALEAA